MDFFKLAITVLGGLSIFIYGMGLMSEGLTQIAGSRLKAALGFMTRNRVAAILAGTGITALIQSSSATTVMTVGFVNAGLLSLEQAIGVIFGANVGTTITGQLVSFKLSDIALPAVTLGVIGLMIAKRQSARGVWRTVLGFGFLFCRHLFALSIIHFLGLDVVGLIIVLNVFGFFGAPDFLFELFGEAFVIFAVRKDVELHLVTVEACLVRL